MRRLAAGLAAFAAWAAATLAVVVLASVLVRYQPAVGVGVFIVGVLAAPHAARRLRRRIVAGRRPVRPRPSAPAVPAVTHLVGHRSLRQAPCGTHRRRPSVGS